MVEPHRRNIQSLGTSQPHMLGSVAAGRPNRRHSLLWVGAGGPPRPPRSPVSRVSPDYEPRLAGGAPLGRGKWRRPWGRCGYRSVLIRVHVPCLALWKRGFCGAYHAYEYMLIYISLLRTHYHCECTAASQSVAPDADIAMRSLLQQRAGFSARL